jgi:uncharacterized protein with NRDE domain
MCTLILLRRPGDAWPLLLAANRDERPSRPSRPPAAHWPEWPGVVGGLDEEAGGSWLALNEQGLVAAVLDREDSLGSDPDAAGAETRRSRGEVVLEALDHAEASEAAGALSDLRPDAYRPFNLVLADPRRAYWLRHGGDGEIRVHPITAGLHMIAATEFDDPAHPRVRHFLPRFRQAPVPRLGEDPAHDDWTAWQALLAARDAGPDAPPAAAMNLGPGDNGETVATLASSLIAVPAYPGFEQRPRWLHAHGAPDRTAFVALDL